jgi:hypothetical protein
MKIKAVVVREKVGPFKIFWGHILKERTDLLVAT